MNTERLTAIVAALLAEMVRLADRAAADKGAGGADATVALFALWGVVQFTTDEIQTHVYVGADHGLAPELSDAEFAGAMPYPDLVAALGLSSYVIFGPGEAPPPPPLQQLAGALRGWQAQFERSRPSRGNLLLAIQAIASSRVHFQALAHQALDRELGR
jgi:hypothetical protein